MQTRLCALVLLALLFTGCGGGYRTALVNDLNATGTHIYSLAVLPNGSRLIVGGQTARVRDKGSYSLDGTYTATTYNVVGFAAFNDPMTGAEQGHLDHKQDVTSVAAAPDSSVVAFGRANGQLSLYDFSSQNVRWTGNLHTNRVVSLAFSPDGKTLASAGGDDQTLRLWRTTDGTPLGVVNLAGRATAVSFSFDGQNVAVTSGNLAKIYDAVTLAPVQTLTTSVSELDALAYSPDGKFLVVGGTGGTISVYNRSDYGLRESLTGQTGDVTSLAFSPDSRTLASGSKDHTATLWNIETGTAQFTLRTVIVSAINAVVFTSDGTRILLGTEDGRLYVYDAATGQRIAVYESVVGQSSP